MKTTEIRREHRPDLQHSIIGWKSIFAGLVISLFVYVTLLALGAGIGGSSASDVIQEGSSANGLATGAAIWIGVSVILSLAAGAYFAARTSTFITGRIGAAQGLIISALFFGFMIYGAGQTIGIAGRGLGSVASAIGMGSSAVASSSVVKDSIEDSLNGMNLKSSPTEVVQGLLTRLLQGNTTSAKLYFGNQTGLSSDELNARFNKLNAEFKSTVRSASIKTAEGLSKAAWTFFVILALGMISALISGAMGTSINFTNPLIDETATPTSYIPRPATV